MSKQAQVGLRFAGHLSFPLTRLSPALGFAQATRQQLFQKQNEAAAALERITQSMAGAAERQRQVGELQVRRSCWLAVVHGRPHQPPAPAGRAGQGGDRAPDEEGSCLPRVHDTHLL